MVPSFFPPEAGRRGKEKAPAGSAPAGAVEKLFYPLRREANDDLADDYDRGNVPELRAFGFHNKAYILFRRRTVNKVLRWFSIDQVIWSYPASVDRLALGILQ